MSKRSLLSNSLYFKCHTQREGGKKGETLSPCEAITGEDEGGRNRDRTEGKKGQWLRQFSALSLDNEETEDVTINP